MTVSAILEVPGDLHYRTAELVRILDPEDVSLPETDPARLLSEANGASGTLFVFDRSKVSALREDAASGATVLKIKGAGDWLAGWEVEVELAAAGEISENTIASVDAAAGTITLSAPGLGGAAGAGRRVRRRLGDWALAGFGTPAQGDPTWGFEVTIPSDLEAYPGDEVRLEVDFVGAAGGDLDRRFGTNRTIVEESL